MSNTLKLNECDSNNKNIKQKNKRVSFNELNEKLTVDIREFSC